MLQLRDLAPKSAKLRILLVKIMELLTVIFLKRLDLRTYLIPKLKQLILSHPIDIITKPGQFLVLGKGALADFQ